MGWERIDDEPTRHEWSLRADDNALPPGWCRCALCDRELETDEARLVDGDSFCDGCFTEEESCTTLPVTR